jgi:hypothetical protein
MNRAQAIVAASAAAEGAFRALSGGRLGWYWGLSGHTLDCLAHFVESHPGASSADLLRYASDGLGSRAPCGSDEALAVAVGTFDATLRNCLSRGERGAAFASSPQGDESS